MVVMAVSGIVPTQEEERLEVPRVHPQQLALGLRVPMEQMVLGLDQLAKEEVAEPEELGSTEPK
jgi:hypothetical protein